MFEYESPASASSFEAAIFWTQELLLGSIATTVVILAVALVGFYMLCGYLPTRDGVRIVIGCFILFGAPVIGLGLTSMSGLVEQAAVVPPSSTPMPPAPPPPSSINPFDPYAGASPSR